MNIAIDSGNSFTKIGFFTNGQLKEVKKIRNDQFSINDIKLPDAPLILSNVSSLNFDPLKDKRSFYILNHKTPIPIVNNYYTPAQLGMDRLAAAVGAKTIYPANHCLVINCGTCITYEFVTEDKIYEGGSISPGINMRFKALNHFTARLPLVEFSENEFSLIGKSTESAILSGILNGVIAETEGIIEKYRSIYPGCKILISGGDSDFFERNIKGDIFAVPDLVLMGLNSILEYNESL